jgi:hypothetical protein
MLKDYKMTTYILGDIHGEYQIMIKLLKKVNLIEFDDEGIVHWKEGCKDTLIQVGDMVDGCDGSISSFNLLKRLQAEAFKEGGEIVRLIGNHEIAYISPLKCTGMNDTTDLVLTDVIKQDVLDGKLKAVWLLDDWIISHAGFVNNTSKKIYNNYQLMMISNVILYNAVKNSNFESRLFNIGKSRGGLHNNPGIFWADWDKDKLTNIKQIVGHTSTGAIHFKGDHINVDCGISRRAQQVYEILKYENGGFEVIKLEGAI